MTSVFGRIASLLGFGSREDQERVPPLFAYLGLILAAYWAAVIVEWVAQLLGERWSIYLRTVGLTATLLVVQSAARVVIWGDDNSWSGWVRKLLRR